MNDSADPNDVIARLRQRKGSGPGPGPAPGPSGPGPPPPGPPPGNSQHPTITLRVGQTERIVNELEDLLIASDRGLYQRGGVIVSTGFTKMKTWDKKDVIVQVIEERGNYAMLEDMQAVANFLGFDKKGKLRPVNPPMALAHTLKDRKSRLRFPIITGIVTCP
jgi:hypothetical protein